MKQGPNYYTNIKLLYKYPINIQAYCLLPITLAYWSTQLCSALCLPSVMLRQRYALLALCLAGVMPFCARKIYLNTLYLGFFCMTDVLFRSFLHETRRFCSNIDIKQKTNHEEAASIGLKQLCPTNQRFFSKYWKRHF